LNSSNFGEHIIRITQDYCAALDRVNKILNEEGAIAEKAASIDAVLIHSGSEQHYFADDRAIPFQAYGHLLHWLPINRPDQFVYFRPGDKPIYYQIVPNDFWYDQTIECADDWADEFTIIRLSSADELAAHLGTGSLGSLAFLGENQNLANSLGIDDDKINPSSLIAYLDYCRAIKTNYELDQLRAASKIALKGHAAAKLCFLEGGTEFQIHNAYLNACNILEEESPYTNIVALNEKSAILHYQHKRKESLAKAQVLLIDAGCRINGYGSDITRTSVSKDVHPVFHSLTNSMAKLELELVAQVMPGMAYQDFHLSALRRLCKVLLEHEVCLNGNSVDDLLEQGIPQIFMPHGVGHLLGIQVHDVGGHQCDHSGTILSPESHSPALRNTRIMGENMVFTIEPGLYFIPMLLEPERNTGRGKNINWKLVDELYCCGGIRVEDNVRVTADIAENLTRQFE